MKQAKKLNPRRRASIRAVVLMRQALRLRPTKIIIGEARNPELLAVLA